MNLYFRVFLLLKHKKLIINNKKYSKYSKHTVSNICINDNNFENETEISCTCFDNIQIIIV